MDWHKVFEFFLTFFFITIPLSIALAYWLITELLDLIFNSGRINNLLKHSDYLDISPLEQNYLAEKTAQANLSQSNLTELKRQINYVHLIEKMKKNRYQYKNPYQENEEITAAKRVADIFKLQ